MPLVAPDISIVTQALRLVAPSLVWLMIVPVAVIFVLPFLVFGGWGKGAFYIVVLGLAYVANVFFTDNTLAWFGLESNSIGSSILIGFIILAIAIFFDWLFNEIAEHRRRCPYCGALVDKDAYYCSHCAALQS